MDTQMHSTPSPVPPLHSRSRRMGTAVLVTALLLIIFMLLDGLTEQRLLEGTRGVTLPTSTTRLPLGPFV